MCGGVPRGDGGGGGSSAAGEAGTGAGARASPRAPSLRNAAVSWERGPVSGTWEDNFLIRTREVSVALRRAEVFPSVCARQVFRPLGVRAAAPPFCRRLPGGVSAEGVRPALVRNRVQAAVRPGGGPSVWPRRLPREAQAAFLG